MWKRREKIERIILPILHKKRAEEKGKTAETEKISSGNKAAGKNVYIYREPVQIGRGLVLALTARP